jgi:hypothetical protein
VTARRPPGRRWPLLLGVVAGLCYSNFLLAWVLQGLANTATVVSELEVPGQPDATLLRATDVASAVLVLPLLPGLGGRLPGATSTDVVTRRVRLVAVVAAWVFALGALLAASIALPCGPGASCNAPAQVAQSWLHDGATVASDLAAFVSIVALWWLSRRNGPRWLARTTWWLFWIGGFLAVGVLGLAVLVDSPDLVVGIAQRVHILCIGLWICFVGGLASRRRIDSVLPPGSEGEVA